MISIPEYEARHSGTVLVCGFGASLLDDLSKAPEAPVVAVNRAAKLVKAFALFTLHPKLMGSLFALEQRNHFGGGFTTHAGGPPQNWPVDHWWPEAKGLGTSSWAAAKMARMMGFDRIVLCGAPLEIGGYADGRFAKAFTKEYVVETYRKYIAQDTEWHRGVYSMSGWTKEFFGAPEV